MKKSILLSLILGGLVFAGMQIIYPEQGLWAKAWTSGIVALATLVVVTAANLPVLVSQEEVILALEHSRRPFLAAIEVVISVRERTGNLPDLEEVAQVLEAMAASGTVKRKISPVLGTPWRNESLFALPERAVAEET